MRGLGCHPAVVLTRDSTEGFVAHSTPCPLTSHAETR